LSDQEKRALYDRHGRAAFEGMAASGPRANATEWASRFGDAGFENIDISDLIGSFRDAGHGEAAGGPSIFEDLMGRVRGSRPGRQRAGRTLEAHLTVPFLTAVRGGETTIQLQRGSGNPESLVVKIPPGIDTGSKLRLKGQGEPGPKGTPAGDLTITIEVEPHAFFKREGQNLSVEVPISVSEAILGARIDVPALDGMKSLTIPPGSSSGLKLRLKGQGIPAAAGKPGGDLFVVLRIVVPKTIDAASRRLIEEFSELNPQHPRAGLW
jgi:DnaJ-class molecular chaperone